MFRLFLATILAFSPLTSLAEESSTNLTIYSSVVPGSVSPYLFRPTQGMPGWRYNQIPGYAVVREKRDISLDSGINQVKFSDVAAFIDPTTVMFKSLTDPSGTSVIEQNFHFDLVSKDKLLEKYIGQTIEVEQNLGDNIETSVGKLLSNQGGITLELAGGKVSSLGSYSNIKFPELPGGLITKPTLIWDVYARKGNIHNVETSYQTEGISWWADYNAVYREGRDENSGYLDLGSWVTIINKSGATYKDAGLKLIAGDVNKVSTSGMRDGGLMAMEMAASPMMDKGFKEKSFFEYHMYTLGRNTTVPDNSTKQIELFPTASSVPVEKIYIYNGLGNNIRYYGNTNMDSNFGKNSNNKVDTYLKFKNEKNSGLGIPLPAGKIRVSKEDSDGSKEFIGEDVIDHTPKNEEVIIKLGNAFDVVGERKQVYFKVDNARRYMDETIEIKVRNHKDEAINVLVKEGVYRGKNWEILSFTGKYDKIDAHTIHFPIRVAKDGEEKIRFTARYSW